MSVLACMYHVSWGKNGHHISQSIYHFNDIKTGEIGFANRLEKFEFKNFENNNLSNIITIQLKDESQINLLYVCQNFEKVKNNNLLLHKKVKFFNNFKLFLRKTSHRICLQKRFYSIPSVIKK